VLNLNNNFNVSDDKKNALLQMASQKLGKSPDELQSMLESGQIGELTQNLDPKTAGQVNALLNNPKALETLLKNDKLRAMLGSLGIK